MNSSSKLADMMIKAVSSVQDDNPTSSVPIYAPDGYTLGFNLINHVSAYRDCCRKKKFQSRYIYRKYFLQMAVDILRNANSSSILERWFSDSLRSLSSRRYTLSAENLAAEGFLRTATKNISNLDELVQDIESITKTIDEKLRTDLESAKTLFTQYDREESSDEDEIGQYADFDEVRKFFKRLFEITRRF